MSHLEDIKAYLRDINLDILMNCPNVKIDISKRYYNKFRLFYPSRKLINYVTKIGGVLTGSRAIRCYTIEGKPILERRVNDWDFVVTLDMAFKLATTFNKQGLADFLAGRLDIHAKHGWMLRSITK